ncbi:hypothetical protein CHS0354_041289 [Potamilus streckersoni]|uniref:DDRGK domain-containing protein 1 n=1 Tax=Potamilus streckersoni TaxID=2493646 RepID=A0AAE0SEJ3_9BIVA|nr:hypothetical protein CHS0354_041289 [Potamilus streckersoni]
MTAVDPGTVYLVVASIIVITLILTSVFCRGDNKKDGERNRRQQMAARPREENAPPGLRRRQGPRHRMQVAQDDSDEELDSEKEDDISGLDDIEGKIGAKKRRKLEEKAERKRHREKEMQEREEQKQREKDREERRKKEEAKLKAEEAARAEEEKKQKEEEEKREYEEYLKLKESFVVEEEGQNQAEGDVDVSEAIDRVQDLQKDGRLTGVIDDRGKFIYITMAEYEAVTKFIQQHGRVSITELAEASNRLINLNPDNAAVKKKFLGDIDIAIEAPA